MNTPEFIKVNGQVYKKAEDQPRTAIRNLRNFWVELEVDGRGPIATGPVSSSGGFYARVKMRDHGDVTTAMVVVGQVEPDGTLKLSVETSDGQQLTVVGER